jgi:hypothetical protein
VKILSTPCLPSDIYSGRLRETKLRPDGVSDIADESGLNGGIRIERSLDGDTQGKGPMKLGGVRHQVVKRILIITRDVSTSLRVGGKVDKLIPILRVPDSDFSKGNYTKPKLKTQLTAPQPENLIDVEEKLLHDLNRKLVGETYPIFLKSHVKPLLAHKHGRIPRPERRGDDALLVVMQAIENLHEVIDRGVLKHSLGYGVFKSH